MFRILVALAPLSLWVIVSWGQTTSINDVLQAISTNNGDLKTYAALLENERLQLSTQNNLPDPQFGAYYLPLGTHSAGNYLEVEITQTVEFPSVYRARQGWINSRNTRQQLAFDSLRQFILFTAKEHCLVLIQLNKRLALEQQRLQQARQLYEQIEALFEAEKIGILEVNKAKIAWLQQQFTVQNAERERLSTLLALQALNGGLALEFTQDTFSDSLSLPTLESVWAEQQTIDPGLALLRQEEELAQKQIELSRKQLLPDLTAGLNYQGVNGDNYFGIFGGVSIPLWSGKHQLPAAEAGLAYQQTRREGALVKRYAELERHYTNYQKLLAQYEEYQTALSGLESDALLLQAYELEQISFAAYYMELQFYRKAQDELLVLEKNLQSLRAIIFKYQL